MCTKKHSLHILVVSRAVVDVNGILSTLVVPSPGSLGIRPDWCFDGTGVHGDAHTACSTVIRVLKYVKCKK